MQICNYMTVLRIGYYWRFFICTYSIDYWQGIIGELWERWRVHGVQVTMQHVKAVEAHLRAGDGDHTIANPAIAGGTRMVRASSGMTWAIVATDLVVEKHQYIKLMDQLLNWLLISGTTAYAIRCDRHRFCILLKLFHLPDSINQRMAIRMLQACTVYWQSYWNCTAKISGNFSHVYWWYSWRICIFMYVMKMTNFSLISFR